MKRNNNLQGIKYEGLEFLLNTQEGVNYKKLTNILNIKDLHSNQKTSQLNGLKEICNYTILRKPTRYLITNILLSKEDIERKYSVSSFVNKYKEIKQAFENANTTLLTTETEYCNPNFDNFFTYRCNYHPDTMVKILWNDFYNRGVRCPKCVFSTVSRPEMVLFLNFKKNYPLTQSQYRIGNKNFDIFVPELNLIIEYDGIFFHEILTDKSEEDILKENIVSENNINFLRVKETQDANNCQDTHSVIFIDGNKMRSKKGTISVLKKIEDWGIKNLNINFNLLKGEIFTYRQATMELDKMKKEYTESHPVSEQEKISINQYDNNGNLINSFGSYKEIINYIKDNINGKSSDAFGFIWKEIFNEDK